MTFCDEDNRPLLHPVWCWTDQNPDLTVPLRGWISGWYKHIFDADHAIKAISINGIHVHELDLERAPLGLLRDNDDVRVRVAVPSQKK